MDLHQILHCLCISNAVCIFDVICSVIKLTPKLPCGAGNTRRDVAERAVCFLTGTYLTILMLCSSQAVM